jgi:hypothetical protein
MDDTAPPRSDTTRAAVRKISKQLTMPPRPAGDLPKLPGNLADITDEGLMKLSTRVYEWIDYVEYHLVLGQIDEKDAANELENIEGYIYVQNKSIPSVTTIKAIVSQNGDVQDAKYRALSTYSYRKLCETSFNRLERAKFILSREVTRRGYGRGTEAYT